MHTDFLLRGVSVGTFIPGVGRGWSGRFDKKGLQDNPVGFMGSAVFVMNKQKWNSLPQDIQKIIDTSAEWVDKQ
jgi:hypothetical protein